MNVLPFLRNVAGTTHNAGLALSFAILLSSGTPAMVQSALHQTWSMQTESVSQEVYKACQAVAKRADQVLLAGAVDRDVLNQFAEEVDDFIKRLSAVGMSQEDLLKVLKCGQRGRRRLGEEVPPNQAVVS